MVIIIGSGAGGGLLAWELANSGIPVTILEKGPYIESKDALNYYDPSSEGLDLLKTSCIGGSTVVSCGNGVRILEDKFEEYGIDLSHYYDYVEELLDVHYLNDSHIGEGTQLFIDSAKELGLNVGKMPKFISESKCIQCGKCAFGCPVDAKWTSKEFVDNAVGCGAKLICNCEAIELISENNKIKAVKVLIDGNEEILESDCIILSAGAIGSPLLLRTLGINAGQKLFMDPFVTLGGVLKDINFFKEIQMNALVEEGNFILSPHFSSFLTTNVDDDTIENKDILSIMVKTPDEGQGYISDEGEVVKINTIQDIRFLAEGVAVAGSILQKAGVDASTISSTIYRGAHPGGSASIGEFVDANLETVISGLYVVDASVLPVSPGAPPILCILALSKKLADYLKKEEEI